MNNLQKEDLIINMDFKIVVFTLKIRENSETQGETAREGGNKTKRGDNEGII